VPLLVLGPKVHLRATLPRGEGGLVPRLQPACVSVWGRDFLSLRLRPRPNACCKSRAPWPARSRARRSSHRCSSSCLYRCRPGSRRTTWDHAAFVAQRRCTISSAFLNDSVILPSVDKLARIVSIGVPMTTAPLWMTRNMALFRAGSRSKNLACRELAFCLLWMHEATRSLNSSCSDARKSPPYVARCVEKSIPGAPA
jgi:hypothetical protein